MSALPPGWLPNIPAAETTVPPYTGDQTSLWAGPGPGIQPRSDKNPAGQMPGIAAMAITADVMGRLAGPQES